MTKKPTKEERQSVQDVCQASEALINWIQSQDIDPIDCIPIMAMAMAAMLRALSAGYGKNPHELSEYAMQMIADMASMMDENEE
jgi:hypothetical protein